MSDGILGLLKKAIAANLTEGEGAASEFQEAFGPVPRPASVTSDVTSERMEPPSSRTSHATLELEAYSTELQVLFVQYDRRKYAGGLERLLSVLEGLGIDYRVLVVDNREPGTWLHSVSGRVTHVGGDNSGWEFSAFDKGLDLLDRWGCRAETYALVTDAFTAYGSEFLGLLTRETIERALTSGSCIGWVDSWPEDVTLFGKRDREWLRTSFIIIPRSAMSAARPLCAPISPSDLFTGDPTAPFKPSAPLDEPLRAFLLEWLVGHIGAPALAEGWHSQFTLSDETFGLFQDKVCAILREHLLSIRLREADVAGYDFRLFRRLEAVGSTWEQVDPTLRSKLAWTGFLDPASSIPTLPPHLHIDICQIPSSLIHGDEARITVEGWVLSGRPSQFAQVRVSSGDVLYAPCNMERNDVRELYPLYPQQRPGFRVEGVLRPLMPGSHELTLHFDTNAIEHRLGHITVLPRREMLLRRVLVPSSWPEGRAVPISIDAEFRGSFPAENAELLLDGEPQSIPVALDPGVEDELGMWVQEITVGGHLSQNAGPGPHDLSLRVNLADGTEYVHRKRVHISRSPTVSASIHHLMLGPYDADRGLTPVNVDLEIFDAEPEDRVILTRDDADIFDVPVQRVSPDEMNRARLAIDRTVTTVPPGLGNFAIHLHRAGMRYALWEGAYLVRYDRPELVLEELDVAVSPTEEKLKHQIRLKGWVKNHFLVDCLVVEIDKTRAGIIELFDLRPDVAQALNNTLIGRQGFEKVLTLEGVPPGEHVVHLIAVQAGGERVRLSRRAFFEDAPARRMSVISDDLEELIRGTRKNFYSAISIRGKVHSDSEALVAALLVNDRLIDEQMFSEPGTHDFNLRAVPERSDEYAVRFVLSARGRVVFSTTPFQVNFQRLEFPRRMGRILGEFLDRMDLRSAVVGRPSDSEIVNRLIELQPDRIPEYLTMLDVIGERLSREATTRPSIVVPPAGDPARSLRVLVVSWETPSRYHGGGVYLTNLLKGLAAKHDITLVHTAGADELGHVDPLKPYLRKVVTVPRTLQPAAYRGPALLPRHFYDLYIPELRRVVELEVETGRYDLVDYEYTPLVPYIVDGPPSVFCVHEMGYTAILNSSFEIARTLDAALPDLDRLLRMFHLNTHELPRLCKNLMTLTEEDAESAARFCPEVTWFTNPTGVDVDHFSAPEREMAGLDELDARSSEMFVYVGNFQHPPNVRAALFFAREVMPLLRMRHPRAELCLIGFKAPQEILDLDGQDGVRFIGFVDDLRPWLKRAAAYVCPIFTGTGMRIKVLEALAAATLVIGTDLSMRGLNVVDGQHYLRANTAQEFLRAATRAITQRDEVGQIAKRGQDLAISCHSWNETVRRRDAIWQHIARPLNVSQSAEDTSGGPGALVG